MTQDGLNAAAGLLEARVDAAVELCLQGNAEAAVRRLEDLAAADPDSVPVLAALGGVHYELGRYEEALACYERVLGAHPEQRDCRLGLARCLAQRPLLALRLRSRRHVEESLAGGEVEAELLGPAATVLLRASSAQLDDPLLLALLRRALVADPALERALTQARRELWLGAAAGAEAAAPPAGSADLAAALAAQCTLDEGAWQVSPEEEARLDAAPPWVRAMYEPEAAAPELLERARRIPALTPVAEGTSTRVRDQYEANPYPRWQQLSCGAPNTLARHLRLLTGGEWEPPAFLERPRLLVAGCGTGRELLGAACSWRPAAVTAFDLSRPSLAYAQQMAERLGVEVELYQADLLKLDAWERQFDVIVCTGVLHHLDDPLAGWRILLRLLRPGGVMLVGLYSETARRGIVAAQAEVRALGVPPTPQGIRAARAHLAGLPEEHPARGCMVLRDYFYLSGCRDMLFHVQEHRFTVPRLAAALDELGLTLLAFEAEGSVRHLYKTLFGPRMRLDRWEKLEELYPGTFLGMYQFWCQKEDEDERA